MSWWNNATTEQRLAQLDGGIECGLTAREIARFSGAVPHSIHSFARKHGRKFLRSNSGADASHKRINRVRSDRSAFIRGEPINLWGVSEPQDEFSLDAIPQHHEEDAQV